MHAVVAVTVAEGEVQAEKTRPRIWRVSPIKRLYAMNSPLLMRMCFQTRASMPAKKTDSARVAKCRHLCIHALYPVLLTTLGHALPVVGLKLLCL